jgi:nucleoside-diphosphate-sugar epimerase
MKQLFMKRALITGGAGFIGLHLSRNLAEYDMDVTILDNFSRHSKDSAIETLASRSNVHLHEGDILDKKTFKDLPGSFDQVYHLAAINGTQQFYDIPDKVIEVGAIGTLNLLEWFSKQETGKLLFSSTSETYAGSTALLGDTFPIPTPEDIPLVVENPSNPRWSYGTSKILGEVAIHAYKNKIPDFAIVRYHNVYGPRMGNLHVIPQFISQLNTKKDPFIIQGGEETRAFCYIDDAICGTQLVMDYQGDEKVFNVGNQKEEIKIKDLAQLLFEVSGEQREVSLLPAPEGSVARRCPDTTRLESLGYNSQIPLREGLKICLDAYSR